MFPTLAIAAAARFLAENREGADAVRIAREVLALEGDIPPRIAEGIVRRLLAGDARFVESDGLWRFVSAVDGASFVAEDSGSDVLVVAREPVPSRSVGLARFRGGLLHSILTVPDVAAIRSGLPPEYLEPEPTAVVGVDLRGLAAVDGLFPGGPRETLARRSARVLARVPRGLEALAEVLSLRLSYDQGGAAAHLRLVGDVYHALVAREVERGRAAPHSGHEGPGERGESHAERLLPSRARDRLPREPGVYVFRDGNGQPLYVGKAKNLRRRLLGHFSRAAARSEAALHASTARITYQVLGSEAEALLREFALIARHAPEWNRQRSVAPGRAGAPDDLLLILPTPTPSRVRLYAVRRDGAILEKDVSRARAARASSPAREARPARAARAAREARAARPAHAAPAALAPIATFYFGSGDRRRTPRSRRRAIDPERIALLLSWYRANRDRVTGVRPSRLAGRDDLLRVLAEHLADPDLFAHRSERV